jgi:predicted GH43/DUF377 family glycosyl hydrolase
MIATATATSTTATATAATAAATAAAKAAAARIFADNRSVQLYRIRFDGKRIALHRWYFSIVTACFQGDDWIRLSLGFAVSVR